MDYRALIPFATPRQAECLQACIDHGSQRKAAKALGINSRGLERSIALAKKSAAKRGYAPDHDMTHTAPSGFSIKGTSTLYGDDGAIKQQWVKTKQEQQDLQELLEQFSQGLADESFGKFKARKVPKVQDPDLMACYVIGDDHLGMYAQADETGVEDFDTDIARNDLIGAFRHLTHSAPKAQVGVLVNVGDFLHANDTTSTTPSSKHLLDTDGRFSRVVDQAEAIFHAAVQLMLEKHQQAWIVNARGNHDPDAAMWINKILRAYYHDEPRVTVLENETKFIYWQWGSTLIGVHHGDRIKRQQIYEAMTRGKRREWGEADHVYFWTGTSTTSQPRKSAGACLSPSTPWQLRMRGTPDQATEPTGKCSRSLCTKTTASWPATSVAWPWRDSLHDPHRTRHRALPRVHEPHRHLRRQRLWSKCRSVPDVRELWRP